MNAAATKAADLRSKLEELRAKIGDLKDIEAPTEEQERQLTDYLDEWGPLEESTRAAEKRAEQLAAIDRQPTERSRGVDPHSVGQINRESPFGAMGELRTLAQTREGRAEMRDRALRVLEERGKHLDARQLDKVDSMLRRGKTAEFDSAIIAERMLLTECIEYRQAFAKLVTQPTPILSQDQADAVLRFKEHQKRVGYEERVASEGTAADGGYGIPVLIDPTIILTSGAADAPLLDAATVKQITTNQWKGVSSPGFSWQYQAESAVVTDNTPTLSQPTIPVYAARGFIPYTLELEQDYPGFEEEMARLLSQGYLNLVAVATMTGSGSSQPTGLFTAMANATTPAHVTVTTAGTLDAATVRKAYAAVPELFRGKSKWAMNVNVENVIRAFGNNLALADFTTNMLQDGVTQLMGKDILRSDYAPSFSGQTTTFSYAVVGDMSQYYIIQRAGMSVELVQHLFDPTTGFPIGQRGWFAFARHGAAPANTNAFRVITNN